MKQFNNEKTKSIYDFYLMLPNSGRKIRRKYENMEAILYGNKKNKTPASAPITEPNNGDSKSCTVIARVHTLTNQPYVSLHP